MDKCLSENCLPNVRTRLISPCYFLNAHSNISLRLPTIFQGLGIVLAHYYIMCLLFFLHFLDHVCRFQMTL